MYSKIVLKLFIPLAFYIFTETKWQNFYLYSVEQLLTHYMDIEKYLQSGKLEQYVLGLSSSEEQKEVEQLARDYPEIDAYIVDLHSCMNVCSESNEIPILKNLFKKQKQPCN